MEHSNSGYMQQSVAHSCAWHVQRHSAIVDTCDVWQGKPQRNFAQTFFLAVQDKGFFVLNDIFRYLRNAPPAPPTPIVPATPNPIENGFASAPPPQQVRTALCCPGSC